MLSQAVGHFQSPPLRKQFLDLIAGIPASTELVLIEPQRLVEPKKSVAEHWLIKWFNENGKSDSVMYFGPKNRQEMAQWIQDQVKQAGGKITSQAAMTLASMVGDDSRQAYQEAYKLLTYVNNARGIDVEDVQAISISIVEGNVFAMVDALANRDGKNASALLHQLLEERDALSIFQMIIRQFRMVLVARELMDNGGKQVDLANRLHIQEFVSKKVWSQARQFSLSTIVSVFHQLLALDYQIKMGEIEDSLGLEALVATFTSSNVKEFH